MAAHHINIIKELHKKYHKDARSEFSCFLSIYSGCQYLRLYKACEKFVPSPAKVLDWGAGNGHFSYFLTKLGYDVDAIEYKSIINRDLIGLSNYRHTKGDLSDPVTLPYASGIFDAVFSVGVLEHVRLTGGNESESLREINRVLKPGGHFVCYHLPNKFSWIEISSKLFFGKYHHKYKFCLKDIKELLEQGMFKIIYYKKYGFLPRKTIGYLLSNKMKSSATLGKTMDIIDDFLSLFFSCLCQNQIIVAEKSCNTKTTT